MRRLLLVLIGPLVGLILLAGCSSSSDAAVTTVDPQAFLTAMSEPDTVVLDVRTPAEYAAGHVAGAVNADVESSGFETQIAALPKDTAYAVYCHSGRRSALASQKLADAGFTSVVNLDGGITDLQAAGATITTG